MSEINMNLPWKDAFKIRTFDVDFKNSVKLSSVFNFMQESASNNAEQLKFGYDDLIKKGLFWVLSRAKIHKLKYPTLGDDIIIETWPKGTDKLFALRDFRIYDSGNEIIGRATTAWLLVDSKTVRPIKPDILIGNIPQHNIEPAIIETPGKITEIDTKAEVAEEKIGYTDIDINQHVNNVRYIDFVLDSFRMDQFKEKQISTMQINFLSESKYEDKIKIFKGTTGSTENAFYVEGVNQNSAKVFQAYVEWV
jgi:medium-chain acyl-[acyl-carrier-protein] hydrolase